MTDQILSIIQNNYNKFTGTNEAELHAAEEINQLFQSKIMAEQAEKHFENKTWSEVNSILLVHFLRMPEEHKIHLLASIKERRPDLFEFKPEETK